MSDEKEFRLQLPGYMLSYKVAPEAFDSDEEKQRLKTLWKRMLEREFKHWIENEYDSFSDREIERNLEDWQKGKIPLSEKLLQKKT